ncbi:hypothetical protein ACA910_004454 [Epithemia clementina (nom. ined.)]
MEVRLLKILMEDTHQIIYRSTVRRADSTSPNLRVDPSAGESSLASSSPDTHTVYIRSKANSTEETPPSSMCNDTDINNDDKSTPMHTVTFDDLIGRTFLRPPEENGERLRARVIKKVIDLDKSTQDREDNIQFILKKDKSIAEELITYNQLMEYIQRDSQAQTQGDLLFRFRDITAHQGPLNSSDSHYCGSKYNVLVEWETGETSYKPLLVIANDNPITCAVYRKKHGLLDEPGKKNN